MPAPSTTLASLLQRTPAANWIFLVVALAIPWLWSWASWPQTGAAAWGPSWQWLNLPWLLTSMALALWAWRWAHHAGSRHAAHHAVYRKVYEHLPYPAGMTTVKDGCFVDVNQAFCDLLGMRSEQLLGQSSEALHLYATPHERDKVLTELQRHGRVDRMRILYRKGQEMLPGMVSAVPLQLHAQDCILFVFHDIRAQEQALQDLHARNRVLTQAGHLAKLGAWEDRRGQGLVYWSDVCYAMHGLPLDSALPSDYLNTFVAPEHRERMCSKLQHCLRARTEWEIEIQIIRTDGKKLWVRSRGEAILDEEGKITAMRGVMQDIDEQKRQEESIREREALLSITLEAAALGRWDWDLHSGMINGDMFWSTLNSLQLFEGPSSLGQSGTQWHWTELMSSHDVPRCNAELLRHIEHPDDGPFDITWRLQPVNGPSRWLRSIGKVVSYDLHGRAMRMLGVCLDVTTQQEQKNNLQQLAHFDPLTGLANRIELAARLSECLVQARQRVHLLGVVYLDLDGFKPVNDRMGHDAGDRLLVLVAKRLQHALRAHDCVARFGGDEFVLLLNELHSRAQCESLLSRIMESIGRPYSLDGEPVQITASMGYTLYPEDDADEDTLVRHADQAMYQAKQAGRNRFQAFDAALERNKREQRLKSLRVREGLEGGEFALYLQPKVDMRQKRVIGVEALARWQHPERGTLAPHEFLPLIEGSELEVPFGQWAIFSGIRTIEQLMAQGLHIQVAVNISARHLQQPGFAQWIKQLLQAHPHIPPKLLDLEITESAALYDIHHVAQELAELRALQVSVSLDDFGTGYSSLTYLRSLPLDTLKIDRSFVRDMMNDPGDFAIVQGVASLAHSFGYSVVAEGVETQEQCLTLERMGCQLAQGFFFAKPMPAHALPQWLANWESPPTSAQPISLH